MMRLSGCFAFLLIAAATARAQTVPATAEAATPAPPVGPTSATPAPTPTPEARLEALEDALRIVSRKLELAEERARAEAAERAADKRRLEWTAAPGRGFGVATERFSANLRARAQIRDTVTVQAGKPTTNELNVKTIRLWLTGHVLTRDLTYGLQLAFGGNDFETGSSSPLFDLFIDYTRLRDLNIRVGQYFVPFDRARTIREFALQLVDRPQIISELTLDRDVGVTFSSTNLFGSKILSYQLGLFGGEGRNRFGGQKPGFLYTLRFVLRPFGLFDDDVEGDLERLRRVRLAFGIAGAYNQHTNRQRSTTGNTLTLGTFDYGHAAADLVLKIAGFSLLAEVVYRRAFKNHLDGTKDGAPIREWSRSGIGWLVQAGMMVHDKIELVARYDQLYTLGTTDPELIKTVAAQGRELGVGANVYLNRHAFKVQADYDFLFASPASKGRHLVRLQLDASF